MISKIYRLKENDVKKVLKHGKPFFSYGIVLNYKNNNLDFNRFSIIISGKNTKGGVERNFFRRKFFDYLDKNGYTGVFEKKTSALTNNNEVLQKTGQKILIHYDCVFLLKKQIKLEKNNLESINSFENDIKFLLKKLQIPKK
ncbi:MAG: ribonuclease P protein component [Candidatus Gracilibacteria bacterium]|nr:ribonuclease P protein component [Candidatus Gracilibacteria bacterium]